MDEKTVPGSGHDPELASSAGEPSSSSSRPEFPEVSAAFFRWAPIMCTSLRRECNSEGRMMFLFCCCTSTTQDLSLNLEQRKNPLPTGLLLPRLLPPSLLFVPWSWFSYSVFFTLWCLQHLLVHIPPHMNLHFWYHLLFVCACGGNLRTPVV